MKSMHTILVYAVIGVLTLIIVILSIILIVGLFIPMKKDDTLTTYEYETTRKYSEEFVNHY